MFVEFGGLKMITDLYRVETFFDELVAFMYDKKVIFFINEQIYIG